MSRNMSRWIWMVLCAVLLSHPVGRADARIAMRLSAPGLQWEVLPVATFTVDDWKNNPGLWSVIITNTDDVEYPYAFFRIEVSSSNYGNVITGNTDIFNIPPSGTVTKNNTDFDRLHDDTINDEFEDDALALGVLPADTYDFTFQLWNGETERSNQYTPSGEPLATEQLRITITNPSPPVLVVPADEGTTGQFPTFQWQMCDVRGQPVWISSAKLAASTTRLLGVTYALRLYRGFDQQGTEIPSETAVVQDPIWEKEVVNGNSALFSTAEASEDLVPGGKYYWFVRAEDEAGYAVGSSDGRSEIWSFTVQFTPPTLTYPAGGEEIMVMPPTFTWNRAVAGGARVYYELSVDTDPGYTTPYEPETISGASHTYPVDADPLPPGTLHYWKVQAVDSYNRRLGEELQETFMTPPIRLISPLSGVVSSLNPSLIWRSYWGVSSYQVRVRDQDNRTIWTKATYTTQAKYEGPPLSNSRTYKWSVRARDVDGTPFGDRSGEASFATPAAEALLVTLTYPVEVIVDGLLPTFEWEELAEATDYVLSVQDDQGEQVYESSTTETRYAYPSTAAALSYDASYRWYVQARQDGTDWGNPSEIATFYTPSEPRARLSVVEAVFTDIAVSWSPMEGATEYTLVISPNPDLSDPLWTHTTPRTVALYPVAAPPLEEGRIYHWRVQGKDAEGNIVGTSTGIISPTGEPTAEALALGWSDLDLYFRIAFPDLFASGAPLEGYQLAGATENATSINPERLRQLLDPADYELIPTQVR